MGFESDPTMLKKDAVKTIPRKTPNIIRQEAVRVTSKTTPPMNIANVEVSPMDPCIFPRKASDHEIPISANPDIPCAAA
jgi:hypothetical protein